MSNGNLLQEYKQLYNDRRWGIGVYVQGILLYFTIVGFLTKFAFDAIKGISDGSQRYSNIFPLMIAVLIYSLVMFLATRQAESKVKAVEERLGQLSTPLGVNPPISFVILPRIGGWVLRAVFWYWVVFSILIYFGVFI